MRDSDATPEKPDWTQTYAHALSMYLDDQRGPGERSRVLADALLVVTDDLAQAVLRLSLASLGAKGEDAAEALRHGAETRLAIGRMLGYTAEEQRSYREHGTTDGSAGDRSEALMQLWADRPFEARILNHANLAFDSTLESFDEGLEEDERVQAYLGCWDGAIPVPAVQLLIGHLLGLGGDTDAALARFEAALGVDDPDTYDPSWNPLVAASTRTVLGELYASAGQFTKAGEQWSIVVGIGDEELALFPDAHSFIEAWVQRAHGHLSKHGLEVNAAGPAARSGCTAVLVAAISSTVLLAVVLLVASLV